MKHFIFRTLLLAVLAVGCQKNADQSSSNATATAPAARVTPIKAERKALIRRTTQPGDVQPLETAPLLAKVSGYVSKVHVDIGDLVKGPVWDSEGKLVKRGQVLLELEVPELAKEVQQKESVVVQAAAAVKVASAAKTSAEAFVSEMQAMTDRAEATYRRWEGENDRVRKLAESSTVSVKVAEETEQQFKAADASRRETLAKIKSAQAKLQEAVAHVEQAEADHQVAQAELGRSAALLSYTRLEAPFDGIISTRDVDIGHLVNVGGSNMKPLLTVISADTVQINIDVPEADAAMVQVGAEVKIRADALAGQAVEGQVSRSAWALRSGTRTLRVEIDLPNQGGRLRPGMAVTADLLVAKREDVLVLPKGAILTQDGQAFCLRIDESTSKLVKHPVKLGLRTATEVEVSDGLTGDELVLGGNLGSFREGQLVEK